MKSKITIYLKKQILIFIGLISGVVFSQTNPALEMATGDSNPTTVSSSVSGTTTIRLRKNTDNPTANTFVTYSTPSNLNVTYTLSNQQYTQTNFTGYNGAVFLGYTNEAILVPLNAFGSTASSLPFTSNGGTANSATANGINITSNYAVQINNNVQPLSAANRATNARWQMADLTINFSRPVNNPYLQINALGGQSNGNTYTAEFDFVSSNAVVSFSKVSGTSQLIVNPTQILNNATTPDGTNTNSARGSVLVSGTGITTLTLRIYTRGASANTGTNWHGSSGIAGDGYMLGVTASESDLRVTKTVNNSAPNEGSNVVFTVTASNLGASNNSNVTVNDLLPAGYTYVSHSASTGTYVPGTGVWTIGNLNDQANATLAITAKVNPTGSFTNSATIGTTSGIFDPNTTNNSASVSTTPVIVDSDGDGVPNSLDLDDDNDGILDCAENGLNKPVNQIFELNGNAIQISPSEVQLTPALNSQAGQMWSYGKVDFTKNFSMPFEAYLGNNDAGADGLAMVFQNDPAGINAIGAAGDGIGARGIQNGVVLELDTYSNTGSPALDPAADHGQIWKSSDQTAITSTVALPNLEDGAWHAVVVNWDSASQTLSYTVDGTVAGTYTGNIVTNYFGGANKVYFGFTASTGGLNNDQRVRFSSLCSLPLELDTDGDGTPNSLDLDSDGDRCFDAIEGGDNVTASMLNGIGRINVAANGATTPVVVDANGVPVVTNTGSAYNVDGQAQGQTIGQSQINNPAAVAGTVGANQTIVSGASPSALSLTGSTGTIQWQSSTDNVNFANILGATAATYSPGSLTSDTYYRAVVSSAGGCGVNTNSVIITVVPNTDSDGDGVVDYYDLDDDNDGILDTAEGQCVNTSNLSIDGFDSPLVATINGNNIQSVNPYNGWGTETGGANAFNVIRVNGAGYSSGPDVAQSGTQYIDINASSTYVYKDITLTTPTVFSASAWFANRETSNGGYAAWSSNIQIRNQTTSVVVAQGNTVNLTAALGDEYWYKSAIAPVSLPAGTYRIRMFVGDFGHLDSISYCFSTDTDGDGTPNYLDLDSDGDGCFDAIEGGDNVTASMLNGIGRINVAANGSTTPVVVDANGVPVVTNTGSAYNVDGQAQGQTIGQSQINNPAAVAGTVGANQTIVSGASPSALSLTGSTGTIQWQSSTDNVTFANILGATSATYSPGVLTTNTYYRAVVSSAGGCTVNTNVAAITVVPNTDTDGDGVVDYYDLDDDNDGILDISEECNGFRVQNSTGVWNGDTVSNLTVNFTGASPQTNVQNLKDLQINYYINQNGGQQRVAKSDNVNFSLSFSTPVKASEIAFYIEDVDPSIATGSPTAQYTFLVNGVASASFTSVNVGGVSPYLVYNGATGLITLSSSTNDHRILLKGIGNQLISSITLTSTGIGTGDAVAYSLLAKKSCDTDGDSTPNYLDVDSDGDGCADAIEGSENVKYNQIHDLNLPLADPNYAYRGQIKVTYNGTTISTPSGIISTSPSANGVPQLLNNAGNNLNASTNPSNLAGVVDNTDGTADVGQEIGDSQDNTINSCKCYKSSSTDGNNYPTNHGITAFNRAGADNQNWPMVRQSGWTALEASTKGFVINRMPASTTGGNAGEPVDGSGTAVITSPISGMMFYDTTNDCLKINVDGTRSGWKCFNNQSCPDEN